MAEEKPVEKKQEIVTVEPDGVTAKVRCPDDENYMVVGLMGEGDEGKIGDLNAEYQDLTERIIFRTKVMIPQCKDEAKLAEIQANRTQDLLERRKVDDALTILLIRSAIRNLAMKCVGAPITEADIAAMQDEDIVARIIRPVSSFYWRRVAEAAANLGNVLRPKS